MYDAAAEKIFRDPLSHSGRQVSTPIFLHLLL